VEFLGSITFTDKQAGPMGASCHNLHVHMYTVVCKPIANAVQSWDLVGPLGPKPPVRWRVPVTEHPRSVSMPFKVAALQLSLLEEGRGKGLSLATTRADRPRTASVTSDHRGGGGVRIRAVMDWVLTPTRVAPSSQQVCGR
jgi:hypothetical protein